jgi:hypothetical protein
VTHTTETGRRPPGFMEPDRVGYERLRPAGRGPAGGRESGLASLLHQGLWAWIALYADHHEAPRLTASSAASGPLPVPDILAEVVEVWADLVLARALPQEVR